MVEPCIHFVGSYIKGVTYKDLKEALIFFTSRESLLGCSIMCDKALKIIRSKFNREENPINIGIADLYFLKGTCVGIFFFFLHFSVQPQFSPRKNNLIIILSRKSNWLQPRGGSSMNETRRAVVCWGFVVWSGGNREMGFVTYHTVLIKQTTVPWCPPTIPHVVRVPIRGPLHFLGVLFPQLWPGLGLSFHWGICLRIGSWPTEAFPDRSIQKHMCNPLSISLHLISFSFSI